ncbi:MAG: PLP-dependent aminotransferase family protein [Chloroflexi bacterium]|nr:PLP-dependent aminotransferase family protein [Chloroflexota bacterium]
MNDRFAKRMGSVKKSFIREILNVTKNREVISFAGGLPNPNTFPVEAIQAASEKMLAAKGASALQYAPTLGLYPLRQFIANRYAQRYNLTIDPDEILITNGSQQGLDLIGKILIDPGDIVLVESPSYLGGIMAFQFYQPEFATVPLREDGIDTAVLAQRITETDAKLFYALPNFQNPTGISYSQTVREEAANILKTSNTFYIEDDPYSELRYSGEHLPSMRSTSPENAFLLGSFSKIVAPGMRMGWVCAPPHLMDKILTAKQGADLHSNYFTQRVLYQFLQDNDLEAHIASIKDMYQTHRDLMIEMLEELFPTEIQFTRPDGGMFLWVTLPDSISSMDLFHEAVKHNVVFVPGEPFYVDGSGKNSLRLNFSNTDPAGIEVGMDRLAKALAVLMSSNQ